MERDAVALGFGSLGDLVRGLTPGAPCPWCGKALQGGTPRLQTVGPEGGTDDCPHGPTLRCPQCGSEVCSDDADAERPARGCLWMAA